jgi:hypothetical protein
MARRLLVSWGGGGFGGYNQEGGKVSHEDKKEERHHKESLYICFIDGPNSHFRLSSGVFFAAW